MAHSLAIAVAGLLSEIRTRNTCGILSPCASGGTGRRAGLKSLELAAGLEPRLRSAWQADALTALASPPLASTTVDKGFAGVW